MYRLLLLVNLVLVLAQHPATKFRVIYEWKYINFTWPTEEIERTATLDGHYFPENVHISGVKYFEDHLYLTIPRMKDGVPATLARIPANIRENNTEPLLIPYPSWKMNEEGNCDALQNVQNIEIDTQGQIWILDGGKTRTLTKTPEVKCPPRLVIFDIKSNSTVLSYVFSNRENTSFLYDLVVDEVDGGYAYITDNSALDPALIVYSKKLNKSWLIRDDYSMKAQQDAVEFTVNGTAVSAKINIAGIALGPRISRKDDHDIVLQDRMVYYAPLSSYRLYAINSAYLRNEQSQKIGIAAYVKDLGRKESQSDGMVMDEYGVLYYGLLSTNSIGRWDSKTPFTTGQKVIARDKTYIQWPDSLAFDLSGNLLVVTNKLQKFIYGGLNINEPNFRILEGQVGAKSYLYGIQDEGKSAPPMGPEVRVEEKNNTYYETHPMYQNDITPESRNTTEDVTISASFKKKITMELLFAIPLLILLTK